MTSTRHLNLCWEQSFW